MPRNAQVARALGLTEPKPHKYGARRTELDGISFPSMKEASRYAELVLMEQAGEITDLEVDARTPIRYELSVYGRKVATYRPDFRYRAFGRIILEDVKGMKTPVFKLKERLFRALHPYAELRIV